MASNDSTARAEGTAEGALTRRTILARAAQLGVAASTLGALDLLGLPPLRARAATASALPEIQFQIEKFLAPSFTREGVRVRYPPVYTVFATFALARTPTHADQATLQAALARIESAYPFSPSGVFLSIAYGIPYFERLPGGMGGSLVAGHMPRLISDTSRYVLEEAVPSPTDLSPSNPGVSKARFQVPVQIESNDVLLTLRSDSSANIDEVLAWLTGETNTLAGAQAGPAGLAGLLTPTSRRLMFVKQGLPRQIAEQHGFSWAGSINPISPMWMGFVSQQTGGSGPAPIVTFQGNSTSKMTTATSRDYFNKGSIQHLSHIIEDLSQWYERPDETYVQRAAEMFGSAPVPRTGNADQFTNGGGPAFISNLPANVEAAKWEAEGNNTFDGQRRLGHLVALQRVSRSANFVPLHIRADGPGFDAMDVPDGSQQPKLQFSMFMQTADFFATMRRAQASPDLVSKFNVPARNQGLERFMTATRRQNFLVPPRRNRSFPLVELT